MAKTKSALDANHELLARAQQSLAAALAKQPGLEGDLAGVIEFLAAFPAADAAPTEE